MYLHYETLTEEEVEKLYQIEEYELQELIHQEKEIKSYRDVPLDTKFYVQNGSYWAWIEKIQDKYYMYKIYSENESKHDITEEYNEDKNVVMLISQYEGPNRIGDLTQMWKDRFMMEHAKDCKHHIVQMESGGIECLNCRRTVIF